MFIKLLLNIFINIALFVLVLSLFWAFNNQFYPIMVGILFALALFVYFKVLMVRSIRELTKRK